MDNNIEKAKALFFDALALFERSNYEAAEIKLREALTFAPTSVSILTNLAVALQRQEKYAEARTHAERAVESNDTNLEALLVLADCYANEEKHTEALRIFDRVISLDPRLPDVHNNRGIILAKRGNYAEALACYNRALEIEPVYSDAQKNRGNALSNLGRFEEALVAYDSALAKQHNPAEIWLERGNVFNRMGRIEEALAAYRTALNLNPESYAAARGLAGLLLSQGKAAEALHIACKMLAWERTQETKSLVASCLCCCDPATMSEDFGPLFLEAISEPWVRPTRLSATCIKFLSRNEIIGKGMAQASLVGTGGSREIEVTPATITALAQERLFLALLQTTPVTDIALERFLTKLRLHLLTAARSPAIEVQDEALATYCAVARQCFINNYVFAVSREEREWAVALRDRLIAAAGSEMLVSGVSVVAVSAYFPLHNLPNAASLLAREWPKPMQALLAQQISARMEEERLKGSMPVLTAISDSISVAVRDQYEENPYPQWVKLPANPDPKPLDRYFRERFPLGSFNDLQREDGLDVLIAGCGTGQQSIEAAQRFSDSRVLAVDLSMTSLCYAERQTRMLEVKNVRYAQADLMQLQETGLTFDVIESTGVLHHLADPLFGWRVLLSLLRPSGVMNIALYSEIARRDIVLAQRLVATRGYRATADDIRKCRAEIIDSPVGSRLRNVVAAMDFFSLDECRDLLFHVQEHRFTIPQIASFLADSDLDFIGFELEPQVRVGYLRSFPADIGMTNLSNWHEFETKHPHTFFGMYNFWVRRRDAVPKS